MLQVTKDIEVDEIVDYNASERFIKLPVKSYLQLLPVILQNGEKSNAYDQLNRGQIALINATNDPRYRFISAALSRRLGKTFISNVIGQLVVLVPGCNVLIMSPNYSLSSISFELQRKFIKEFDLEVERDNLKDKVIELANGSTVRMGSVSKVNSCVGRSYDLIIFDEAALVENGDVAFNVALRPTLDKPGSKAIFISTPRGKNNWFSLFFERGKDPYYKEWISITADYTENHRMLENDVEDAKRTMSKAQFEQEYLASFVTFEGQIFNVKESNIAEFEVAEGDTVEYFAGIDPGYRDPLAFIVIAYVYSTETYWIVDEYLESERVTAVHVDFIREKIAKWNVETIFIDAAAAQFAADLAYTYDIATIKGKKDPLAGIALIQTLIETGKLKISPTCVKTLTAFDQYQWDTRETLTKEKPMHEHSHIPDAVRYAIHTMVI